MPSEQMTVVLAFGGTTTVVLVAGRSGLLLLMQPDSRGMSINIPANKIFI